MDIRVAVVIAGGVWISMGKLLGIIWVIYVEGDVERFSFFLVWIWWRGSDKIYK